MSNYFYSTICSEGTYSGNARSSLRFLSSLSVLFDVLNFELSSWEKLEKVFPVFTKFRTFLITVENGSDLLDIDNY